MSDEVTFNPESLTLDEADVLEELAGKPVGEVMVALMRGKFSARDLRAITVVVKRRTDPEFGVDAIPGDTSIKGILVDAAASGIMADAVNG